MRRIHTTNTLMRIARGHGQYVIVHMESYYMHTPNVYKLQQNQRQKTQAEQNE